MNDTQPLAGIEVALSTLAVLGEANPETLSHLLALPLDAQMIAQMMALPGITKQGGLLVMSPDIALPRLKALEEEDFLHFRLLHQQAVILLAEQLNIGNVDAEVAFMAVFTRLAEHLRHQDPTKLPALIDAVGHIPLKNPKHQHYRTYMEGISLQQTGQYDALLKLCDGLLSQPDLELALRGRTHNLRATSFYFLGRLQQALDDYRLGFTLMQQSGNNLGAAIALQNMGALAYDLQDYEQAETRLRQAAEIFENEASAEWMAAVQNELGLVYRDQGKWAEASQSFERFIANSRQRDADDDVAIGLLNLGEVLFFQGHLQEAEDRLAAALDKMSTDAFRIDLLLNLGMIRQINGDFMAAKRYYQEALELTTRLGRRFMLAAVHFRLARVCQEETDPAGTLRHLLAGIDVVEETRAPLREEGLKITLLGRWQQLYEETVLLLIGQKRFGEAFHYVERARSRAFLDMLADATDRNTEKNTENNAENDQVGVEEPLTISELQAQLPAESALVEFFATGLPGSFADMLVNIPQEAQFLRDYLLPRERLLAFVITNEAVEVVELEVNVRQISALHFHRNDGRLRGLQPIPGQPLRPLTRWPDLAARLLWPLQPYIAHKQHLYLVPHGVLHYLPFHALANIQEVTGTETTISYGPSASILFKRSLAPLSREKHNVLAIGVNGAGLQHSEAEAAWLAHWLNGDLLLGPKATHTSVTTALPDYSVIHFSCHGHFRQRNPLESALELTDGELTAIDLLHIGRLSAELVTLSACDTGLNQLHPGDELMGLTRAFLGCGTRSLLATLWPVYEIPTRIFIQQFYTAWKQGASKAKALSIAQQRLIHMNNTDLQNHLEEFALAPTLIAETISQFTAMLPGPHPFAHPYYWGAFLLIGDPI